MALKTFNLDESAYRRYSSHCKKAGISMSKQIDRFINEQLTAIEKSTLPLSQPSTLSSEPELPTRHSYEHSMRRFC